ncbi:hypothetical protein M8818_001493 [Zalaria obscura]|uniref:Uncharacterized protein n=1 Tax=Zalaria obscura TaxID=2024903 RepID=A0ACC3SKL5_9PEZI
MAEPFSIATGAIGVVSLAIQLLHSAYKLRRFFRDVRNAPKELLETITYIDKLVHQLDSIRHEGRRYPGDGPAYDGLATHIKDLLIYNSGYRDHEAQEPSAAMQDLTATMIPLTQDARRTSIAVQHLPGLIAPLAQDSHRTLEEVRRFPELIDPLIQSYQHIRTELRAVSSSALITDVSHQSQRIHDEVCGVSDAVGTLLQRSDRIETDVLSVSANIAPLRQETRQTYNAVQGIFTWVL